MQSELTSGSNAQGNLGAHFLLIASPKILFHAELLLRSLSLNGQVEQMCSLCLVDSSNMTLTSLRELFPFVARHADVLFFDQLSCHHPPVRWFVDVTSDVTIFLDCDVLVRRCVQPLIDLCRREQKICGMLAHKSHVSLKEWEFLFAECGFDFPKFLTRTRDGVPSPYYVNYGVLAVPSSMLRRVREVLPSIIQRVQQLTTCPDFTGQLALTIAIEGLKLPRLELPLRYNYPDAPCYDDSFPEELRNVLFYHMLDVKRRVSSLSQVQSFLQQADGPANYGIARGVLRAILENAGQTVGPAGAGAKRD